MRKKIVKIIESVLPDTYNDGGELLSKRTLANKILNALPHPERLDIEPFQTWIPSSCSSCRWNMSVKFGCTYDLSTETVQKEYPAPRDCALGYS
jgi:hypothetical protein